MKKIIVILITVCVYLQASTYQTDKSYWKLLGALEDITLKDDLANCLVYIFDVETQQYKRHDAQRNNIQFNQIKRGSGFFIRGSGGTCTIKTNGEPLAEQEATYTFIFTVKWTSETHPVDFPSNDHFSPPFLSVLRSDTSILKTGSIATDGIKLMAETGSTSLLEGEVDALINSSRALSYHKKPLISSGEGQVTFSNIKITQEFSKIRVVSMIAPSPDWFVAAQKQLFNSETKTWQTRISIPLLPYDSGTDSGLNYTSSDLPTNPRENIHRPIIPPLGDGEKILPIGTLEIIKVN